MMTPLPAHQVVLIMHSEPIIAVGLQYALAKAAGLDVRVVRGAVADSTERVVVLCDDGLLSSVLRQCPEAAVVVLARTPREFEIQHALERGVLGYLATSCHVDEVEYAVRAAASGRHFLCRAAAEEMASAFGSEALTQREHDVLMHLARGSCNKTIASELDIALGTVKAHVRSILGKLKAATRTEAASIASARGLVRNGDSVLERRGSVRDAQAWSASRAAPAGAQSVFVATKHDVTA